MPTDSLQLRNILCACMPSIVIDGVAKQSGQRVVYYAHFEDDLIPNEIHQDVESSYLKGWGLWGKVVVKVVSGASTLELTRLQAEAALLQGIETEKFPRLFYANYFTENPLTEEVLFDGLYVSIEEYIESEPLSAKAFSFHKRPIEVLEIAEKIVLSMRPLWEHKRRLVHRDLKPDNILITPDDKVVIIDFGIIRETGVVGVTQEGYGLAPGSVGYAAPEHIANQKELVTYKTDFFSLGVIMYELISGSHPFIANPRMHPIEVIEATEMYDPPTLHDLGLATPSQSQLVREMMSKKPYLRPRTVDILMSKIKLAKES